MPLKKKTETKKETKTKVQKRKTKDEEESDYSVKSESEDESYQLDLQKSDDSDGQTEELLSDEEQKPQRGKDKGQNNKKQAKTTPSKPRAKKFIKSNTEYKQSLKEEQENNNLIQLQNNSKEDVQFDESQLPEFAQKANLRDAAGRKIDDENYDKTSLQVPQKILDKYTKTMQQYWDAKSKYFDCVVAFKIWKFYYTYYEDAFHVSRLCDYRLTNQNQNKVISCFFHESCLPKVSQTLIANNMKITVVEQMDLADNQKNSVMRREICQVISRGTYTDYDEPQFTNRFLLSILQIEEKNQIKYGFTLMDVTTREFMIGEIDDDENGGNLRTLLVRTKPIEILHPQSKEMFSTFSLQMCKNQNQMPTFTNIREYNKLVPIDDIIMQIKNKFVSQKVPSILQEIIQTINLQQEDISYQKESHLLNYMALQSLYQCIQYLDSNLLGDSVLLYGNFKIFDLQEIKQKNLYMDSQALTNLEIIECNFQASHIKNLSLFDYINQTNTAFGGRLLKQWVLAPLTDVSQIEQRQKCVIDLVNNPDIRDYFGSQLSKLPDLERMMYRTAGVSKQRLQAIYRQDFVINKLKDFLQFIKEMKKVQEIMETFENYKDKFQSQRLKNLVTIKDDNKSNQNGLFPRLNPILEHIENQVIYKEGVPTPTLGLDPEYDQIMNEIEILQDNLNQYLLEQKKRLNYNNITYVHSKHRYEIELPDSMDRTRPQEYSLTSKRKGFIRYHTPYIEQQTYKMMILEMTCKDRIIPFVIEYFKRFLDKRTFWQQMISCLGELDALCALANTAEKMDMKCIPILLKNVNNPVFELQNMVHPCVEKMGVKFVPNDTIFQNDTQVLLITGPNMGGKSTLLRQSCIAIILAQIGSYVPAKQFQLTPMDRIFTRIGASDRLMEGKSTFFVEMEESKSIVSESTRNSFAIIDELGRGTSTYDGAALAYGVLKYLIEDIKCLTLFSTHYHMLTEDFQSYKNLRNFHMSFKEEEEKVQFLYKFVEGYVPKSFGINVARMAGIPQESLIIAKEKSQSMIKEKKNIMNTMNLNNKFNSILQFFKSNDNNINCLLQLIKKI